MGRWEAVLPNLSALPALPQVSLNDIVYCLNVAFDLWMGWWSVESPEAGIVKLFAIVRDDGMEDTEAAHNASPHEVGYFLLNYRFEGLSFYPDEANLDRTRFGALPF